MSAPWTGLLAPPRLYAGSELRQEENRPPARPGVYGWYFDRALVPTIVPLHRAHALGERVLLYVGIAPSREGGRSHLRSRLRTHCEGTARRSTLRLSIGCLLASTLDLHAVLDRSGRVSFGDNEGVLSRWLEAHARVCWIEDERPWLAERQAIAALDLPLNLEHNDRHEFHPTLSKLRREAKAAARGASRPD